LKYGCSRKFTGFQHLDIFGVFIEVEIIVEAVAAVKK